MKKFLPVLLTLALCLSLTACKKENTSSDLNSSIPNLPEEITSSEGTNSNEESSGSQDTAAKPSESSKPTTTNNSSQNNSSDQANVSQSDSAISIPTISASSDWEYHNGGNDHIIKTNGIDTIKIPVPSTFGSITAGVHETEYGIENWEFIRDDFLAYEDYVFFRLGLKYTWDDKSDPENSYTSEPWEFSFFRVKNDGTQHTEIGCDYVGNGTYYGVTDIIKIENGYLYFTRIDFRDGPTRLYRIPANSPTLDLMKDGEFIEIVQ